MATEEIKTVEVPKEETVAPVEAPAVTPAAVAPIEAPAAPAESATATTETPAVEATEPTETSKSTEEKKKEKKDEVKPIEEGTLEFKKAAGFPKSLIKSRQFFWLSNTPVDLAHLGPYFKSEKVFQVAQHNASWASHTGEGLLFHGEKKDAITGIINLAEITDLEIDGPIKFHFTSLGVKHTFYANTKSERDGWVSSLKTENAEANEKSSAIIKTETYKKTHDSLKDKHAKKAEAPAAEAAKEEAPKEELPKVEKTATGESSKAAEPTVESPKEEAPKTSERRSSSRRRLSRFAFVKSKAKKDDAKEGGDKAESPVDASSPTAEEGPTAAAGIVESPTVETATSAEEKNAEDKAAEKSTEPGKFTLAKRGSIFDVFKSKEKKEKSPAHEPTAETPAVEAVSETPAAEAPVIPPVEATTPLAADVSSAAATAPSEATETAATATPTTPAASPAEKPVRSDRRKSSMPFVFGKKEKAAETDEAGENREKAGPSMFSRFRNTIKRSPSEKIDKPAEKENKSTEKIAESPAEATAAKEETPAESSTAPVEPLVEEESSKPAVSAAAPVTAAA